MAVLAAKMAGIKLVMVPEKNRKDIAELEEEIKEGIDIKYAECAEDVWKYAIEK